MDEISFASFAAINRAFKMIDLRKLHLATLDFQSRVIDF